jgi:hypothetical protein
MLLEYDLLKIQFNLGMGKRPVALHCVELCTRISFGEIRHEKPMYPYKHWGTSCELCFGSMLGTRWWDGTPFL